MTTIRTEADAPLDFLALGALVHRFDPGVVPFRKARECAIHVSGAEFNVAANLADCFGLSAGVVSALVDYPIGDLIAEAVRSAGVKAFYKHFSHDGVTGPNMAAVYSDRGYGVRPPVVFYNRSNEAAARLRPGDFDWGAIFGREVRWFHSGGLFAALSPTTSELIIEATQAAKAAGATVSFDLNYREKLWNFRGGNDYAVSVFRRIVENVDVLVGNEEDLQRALGISGPAAGGSSAEGNAAFIETISQVTARHPNIRVVATSLRHVQSSSRHSWAAIASIDGEIYSTPTCELDVLDRIGGGDGFASGLFYGLLTGEPPGEAVKLGWAHGALLTTFPGDTTMATLDQVRALARGGSARVQR
ncbi:MAG: sugar kinase [Acidimicrobiales bacterium]